MCGKYLQVHKGEHGEIDPDWEVKVWRDRE